MTKQPEPPTLQPIEDAPEGVDLMLFQGNKSFVMVYRKLPSGDLKAIGTKNYGNHATHWMLWPKLPKPKTTWDEYMAGDEFRFGTFETARKSKFEDHIHFCKALRDFLNFHYPITQDNE